MVKLTKNATKNVQELKSNEEESDTRLVLRSFSLPITNLKVLLCTPLIVMF